MKKILLIFMSTLVMILPVLAADWVEIIQPNGVSTFLDKANIIKDEEGYVNFKVRYFNETENQYVVNDIIGHCNADIGTPIPADSKVFTVDGKPTTGDKMPQFTSYIFQIACSPDSISKLQAINKPPDLTPYVTGVTKEIRRNFKQGYAGAEDLKVVFNIRILKDGTISYAKLEKSSGNDEVDKNATKALKISSPVAPLPEEHLGQFLDMEFTFDYRTIGVYENRHITSSYHQQVRKKHEEYMQSIYEQRKNIKPVSSSDKN